MGDIFVPGFIYMGPPTTRLMAAAAPSTPEIGYVYYLLDRSGVVLYIGQSHDPAKRWKQHRQHKDKRHWRDLVEWVQIWADFDYAISEFERWQIRKIQPRFNRALTDTHTPLTPELSDLAVALDSNPEWLRGRTNGGPCAGDIGNFLRCKHGPWHLCGELECEAQSAREVLTLIERSG